MFNVLESSQSVRASGVWGIKFTTPTIYEVPRPHGPLLTETQLFADRGGRGGEACEIFCLVMNRAFRMSEASDEEQTGKTSAETNMHGESWRFHTPIFHLT